MTYRIVVRINKQILVHRQNHFANFDASRFGVRVLLNVRDENALAHLRVLAFDDHDAQAGAHFLYRDVAHVLEARVQLIKLQDEIFHM